MFWGRVFIFKEVLIFICFVIWVGGGMGGGRGGWRRIGRGREEVFFLALSGRGVSRSGEVRMMFGVFSRGSMRGSWFFIFMRMGGRNLGFFGEKLKGKEREVKTSDVE